MYLKIDYNRKIFFSYNFPILIQNRTSTKIIDNSFAFKKVDLTVETSTPEYRETSIPEIPKTSTPKTPNVLKFCEEKTACMWRVYGNNLDKRVDLVIRNQQCVCSEDMRCTLSEDSLSMGAFVYRCNSTLIS